MALWSRAHVPPPEKPPQWEAHAPEWRGPHPPQLEKPHAPQWRPSALKGNAFLKKLHLKNPYNSRTDSFHIKLQKYKMKAFLHLSTKFLLIYWIIT